MVASPEEFGLVVAHENVLFKFNMYFSNGNDERRRLKPADGKCEMLSCI